MSRYRVTVDGQQYDVDIDNPHARPVTAEIAGVAFSVDVEPNRQNDPTGPDAATPTNAPGSSTQSTGETKHSNGLTAPIPGVVASIAVTHGQSVKRGEELLTLEAMKMLNVIRSPQDGVIETVHVTEGAQVSQGAPLVTFAPR